MLQLKKYSPFEATLLLAPDPDGVDALFTIIKGTFAIGEKVVPAPRQQPIVLVDKYRGEPGQSSIELAGDVGLVKPRTDVLLLGHASPPGGQPVSQMEVTLKVGSAVRKTIRVFGDRVWSKGLLSAKISPPEPFIKMPLTWERAFGGNDVLADQPGKLAVEDRNPVGKGFRLKHGKKPLDGLKLPNLESPGELIRSWSDRPAPVAFAPLCPTWLPRKSFAGTYDETWQKNRSPYLPTDFDSRFFQQAPLDQISPAYLQGGEEVEVGGVIASGPLRFRLPQFRFEVVHRFDSSQESSVASLDTVLIEPDEFRLVLVWRAIYRCDKKAMQVREIEVTSRPVR